MGSPRNWERRFTVDLRKNNPMFGKLFGTVAGNRLIIWIAALVGAACVLLIDSPRTGTIVFVAVTCIESGLFSAIYGLRSDWRGEPAARAVFWSVFTYFLVAAQLLTLYVWTARPWWSDDLRELLYLFFMLAGLNLLLTVIRILGRRVYRRRAR